ncbi:Uncharacterized protein {ECO:0000313/EMBL:CCF07425.1} [Pantoea ananatis]|nr:hypothetical protein PANA5342_0032 [Pantoea ananatis LMG 5342]CRH31844.1 Uncharacterized protein BN1183_AA_00630 [Pantoea ananatis]CRH35082.1 Uncharacterized protein {ECO:0000313/EMBL:CCF07425.1} [Pantoea ananatis]
MNLVTKHAFRFSVFTGDRLSRHVVKGLLHIASGNGLGLLMHSTH